MSNDFSLPWLPQSSLSYPMPSSHSWDRKKTHPHLEGVKLLYFSMVVISVSVVVLLIYRGTPLPFLGNFIAPNGKTVLSCWAYFCGLVKYSYLISRHP